MVVTVEGDDGGASGAFATVILCAGPAACPRDVVARLPVVDGRLLATERERVGGEAGAQPDDAAGKDGLSTGRTCRDLHNVHGSPPLRALRALRAYDKLSGVKLSTGC